MYLYFIDTHTIHPSNPLELSSQQYLQHNTNLYWTPTNSNQNRKHMLSNKLPKFSIHRFYLILCTQVYVLRKPTIAKLHLLQSALFGMVLPWTSILWVSTHFESVFCGPKLPSRICWRSHIVFLTNNSSHKIFTQPNAFCSKTVRIYFKITVL